MVLTGFDLRGFSLWLIAKRIRGICARAMDDFVLNIVDFGDILDRCLQIRASRDQLKRDSFLTVQGPVVVQRKRGCPPPFLQGWYRADVE